MKQPTLEAMQMYSKLRKKNVYPPTDFIFNYEAYKQIALDIISERAGDKYELKVIN